MPRHAVAESGALPVLYFNIADISEAGGAAKVHSVRGLLDRTLPLPSTTRKALSRIFAAGFSDQMGRRPFAIKAAISEACRGGVDGVVVFTLFLALSSARRSCLRRPMLSANALWVRGHGETTS